MKMRSAGQMYVEYGLVLFRIGEVKYSIIMTQMEEMVRRSISQMK